MLHFLNTLSTGASYHYYVFQVFVSLCWYTIPYCHLKMKPEMEEELELSLMTL